MCCVTFVVMIDIEQIFQNKKIWPLEKEQRQFKIESCGSVCVCEREKEQEIEGK